MTLWRNNMNYVTGIITAFAWMADHRYSNIIILNSCNTLQIVSLGIYLAVEIASAYLLTPSYMSHQDYK